ncbi:hypothetical protein DM860_017137 [Cuscuta australis]|uniref:Uncharacterized protein n=1 Tax=Cuscuta australis TaxID=267555 RepID=A0A328D9P7_9ASTE|nr:hypothetical protein DM860_017137 [Cuscuta australis]
MAGFVSLLEVCKSENPQLAIVCASSSSVYGLNSTPPPRKPARQSPTPSSQLSYPSRPQLDFMEIRSEASPWPSNFYH